MSDRPRLMVPPVMVRAIIRKAMKLEGRGYKPGAVVSMAYGIALHKIVTGYVGAIVNAEFEHMTALESMRDYGADSWFPTDLQTIGKLSELAAEKAGQADLKTPERAIEPTPAAPLRLDVC